jgi:hypothetical protein
MASEKKPSIYSDRSTIGSSAELDEYGVWVKSESQDLSAGDTESQFIEETLPDVEDLPDFGEESLLDEEKLSDLDIDGAIGDEESLLPDIEDLPDFDLPEDTPAVNKTDDTFDLFSNNDSETPDISLDISDIDLGGETEDLDTGIVNFDDLSQSDKLPEVPQEAPEIKDDFAEISMEDFLGEVSGDLDTSTFTDLSPEEASVSEVTIRGGAATEAGKKDAEPAKPKPVPGESESSRSQDVNGPDTLPVKGPANEKSPELDLSTQLLMKIAEELSSIKTEISSLKQELSGIRNIPLTVEENNRGGKGFLDEADDEKIALTGDELNNIFNTANFTEEVGADAVESTAEEFVPEDEIEAEPEEVEEFTEPVQEVSEDLLTEEPLTGERDGIDDGETFPDEISFEESVDISSPEEFYEENVFEEDLIPEESQDVQDELPGEDVDEIEETELEPEISLEDEAFSQGFETDEAGIPPIQEEEILEDAEFELPEEEDFSSLAPEEEMEIGEEAEDDSIDIDISDEPISAPLGFEYTAEDTLPMEVPSELQLLQEEGVTPMTAAPDDTSYLDEAPLEEDENFEEEPLDLSNAVIDEPDLSGDVVENPIQEPSPESISLDLETEEPLELPEEDVEEVFGFTEDNQEESIDIPEIGFDSNELSSEEVENFQDTVDYGSSSDIIETPPEEESFAQVFPEDFVVEADNTQVPFDNALAMEEPGVPYADTGELVEEAPEKPGVPDNLKQELKVVLSYMDQLLESLPEEKIEEFAQSEYYDTYKKLFEELGLV